MDNLPDIRGQKCFKTVLPKLPVPPKNTKKRALFLLTKWTRLCTILSGGELMNFYSVRDLRTDSKSMWQDLTRGDEVVLTNNGKPSALIIDIPEGSFDEIVHAVRQAKAMIALNSMRRKAAKTGFMSDDEIESLIDEARNGG